MTTRSTRSLATPGAADAPTPITSNGLVPTPSAFADSCRAIVKTKTGHEAHRALDALVTNLLSRLGYGEGMAIFIANVGGKHPRELR
jgi:hypothetical protein